jgi:peptidoglycan-associated lipoprotein
MNNFFKIITASALFSLAACSSTGGTENENSASVNADTKSADTQVNDAERLALATNVFYFGFDNAELNTQDRAILVYHAARLRNNMGTSVRLEGHASEEGTREYNIALGERRSKAIAVYLMANGVSASQIETVSYGEERPAVQGSTEQDRAKNRRVEIK